MKSFLLKIALLLTVVVVVACSKSDIDEVLPQQPITDDIAQQGEVRIVIPGGTRSVLEDNGNGRADLRWTSGDEIKLVARDASGADAFTPCIFYFWANKNVAGESYFRTPSLYGDDRETTMLEGSYIYYAVSPSTAIIDGTTAKFTLPATQDGEFSADVDFMVAKAEGSKLVACQGLDENGDPKEETDPKNNLPLVFKHKTHILRFTIPSGNNIFGQKVKKLHMVFPTSVAGTMAVDMDNGTIASTENTTNKITVDFAEPKDAGDEFYVMILPQANVFSKSVDMRFEGVDGTTFSMRHQVNFPQPCSENRLTPVRMSIPAATGVTSFYYTEGTNNLGEDLWSMNITLPDGCYFTDFEQTRRAPKVDGKYTFSIFNDMLGVVENKTLPFAFESENALIPQTVTIRDLTDGGTTNLGSMNVPYLFFEDFSNVKDANDGYAWNKPDKGSMMTSGGLINWSGSRWKTDANNEILVLNCYVGTTVGNTNVRFGRADTPALSHIKEGKSPRIKVVYDLGLVLKSGRGLFVGNWKIQAQLRNGISEYSAENPITFGGYYAVTELSGTGPLYPSTPIDTIWDVITCDKYNLSKMNKDISFTTTANNLSRITWFEDYYKHSGSPASQDLELYLDNIRVTIE